jgi:hypothetical protein
VREERRTPQEEEGFAVPAVPPSHNALEPLEHRVLMKTPWGYWPDTLGLTRTIQNYPWLDGGGKNVGVVDKGIDYWHPALGGNRATHTKSPRVVNVYDWRDNDTDPFPSDDEALDTTSPHGTGVAGILIGVNYTSPDTLKFRGVLQNSKVYNLRQNRLDTENTIKKALQWIVANRASANITAVNLTDFEGTVDSVAIYEPELKALWDAGVFIATPLANNWNLPEDPHEPIGPPGSSPYVFGIGGENVDGDIYYMTERGEHLDLLGPAQNVQLPYYVPSTGSDIWVRRGQGNSWATPYTVGTAVLMQQIDPTITPAEIMQILQDSGTFTPDPDADLTGIPGYSRLNIYGAVGLTYARRDDRFDQMKRGNDDLGHARTLGINRSGNGWLEDLKLLMHDHDYFAFDVRAGTYNVTVGYTGGGAFPTGELLDSAGKKITNVGGGAGVKVDLPAGRYFLHEYNATQSLTRTYSLVVQKVSGGTPKTVAVRRSLATERANGATAVSTLFAEEGKSLVLDRSRTRAVWSDTPVQ